MAAVKETIEQVKTIDVDQYKYGFETQIESVRAPKGLDESTVRYISAKKNEPAWLLEWRLEAFHALEGDDGTGVGQGPLSEDRLPGSLLLLGAEIDGRAEEPEGCRSGTAQDVREARHSAQRTGNPRGRHLVQGCGRCRLRQRLGGHDLQGGIEEGRRHLLLDLGGRARASRTGEEVFRHASCRSPTTSMRR